MQCAVYKSTFVLGTNLRLKPTSAWKMTPPVRVTVIDMICPRRSCTHTHILFLLHRYHVPEQFISRGQVLLERYRIVCSANCRCRGYFYLRCWSLLDLTVNFGTRLVCSEVRLEQGLVLYVSLGEIG